MRDYKHEYNSYHSSSEQKKNRAMRNAARRKMMANGSVSKGDGKDVDHKNGNPRDNSRRNLVIMSMNRNRSKK